MRRALDPVEAVQFAGERHEAARVLSGPTPNRILPFALHHADHVQAPELPVPFENRSCENECASRRSSPCRR